MKIEYLGHASFLITTSAGTRVVTDPIDSAVYPGTYSYDEFNEKADAITISHGHKDHSGVRVVKGDPVHITAPGRFAVKDVEFLGVATYHDDVKGEKRGRNTVFVISADGVRVAHMGDLGHVLTGDQAAEIGNVDVALIPVGGYFSIDAEQAHRVADQLDANIVIPMHYKTAKCESPIAGLEGFVEGRSDVISESGSVIEVTKDTIPSERRIVVLNHRL